jgi:hypothetical protein
MRNIFKEDSDGDILRLPRAVDAQLGPDPGMLLQATLGNMRAGLYESPNAEDASWWWTKRRQVGDPGKSNVRWLCRTRPMNLFRPNAHPTVIRRCCPYHVLDDAKIRRRASLSGTNSPVPQAAMLRDEAWLVRLKLDLASIKL